MKKLPSETAKHVVEIPWELAERIAEVVEEMQSDPDFDEVEFLVSDDFALVIKQEW